jgi:competence ComEA-like helix-hairpin-helix protein
MRVRLSRRAAVLLKFAGLLCFVFALSAASLSATKKPPAHPIDINSASSTQLQEVPGIGPATADKILQMRKSYGAFKSVDDLLSVRGIGPKRLEKMRKYLVAGHAVQRRGAAPSVMPAKGAACANCSRAAPVASSSSVKKTAAAVPAKPAKQPASDGDAANADEEPE